MENPPAAQEVPPTPPETTKPRPTWSIIIVVLVVLILAVSAFIAYQLGTKQTIPAASSVPEVTVPTPAVMNSLPKIAYGKVKALWTINSDGTGTQMLVPALAADGSYSGLDWKGKYQISYIVCLSSCTIRTHSISSGADDLEANPGETAGETRISALAWNHVGTQLAYLYTLPDAKTRLDFKTGAVKNTVKTFASSGGGRGGSLDDNASVYFSPDDKYVLVTYTGNQPNDTDKSTVWVFDSSGKEIVNLLTDAGWPTQARWMDNDTFIYKKGDKLYQRVVTNPASVVLPDTAGYNPIYLGGKIYSWTNGDLPKIGTIEGYYRPEVLDDTHLVALKAAKLPPDEAIMISFKTVGLSVIDVTTNQATDLDTGEISLFSVSP